MICPICWHATKANVCPLCGCYTMSGIRDRDPDDDEHDEAAAQVALGLEQPQGARP